MRGFGSIARIPAGSSSVTVAHTIDSRRARSLASACDPRDRSVDRYGADVFVGSFANRAMGDANAKWKQTSYRFLTANARRQLIAGSPDLQTS